MSTSRSDHLTIGGFPASAGTSGQTRSTSPTASTSPNDPSSAIRSPFGLSASKMVGVSRSGSGSPSHEMGGGSSGRLFSKRAREIQAQEGVPVNPWGGPPTSGNSTPLRENIPESPTDGFPDFAQLPTPESMPQTRRARAGTVPSRFSPGGAPTGLLNIPTLASMSSRPTPAQSPFKSPSPSLEPAENPSSASTLLSRLRAGSMPQRSPYAHIPGTSSPFGPSIFSSWNPSGGRERGATLASIASVGSNGPSSPAQSAFSREGTGENDVHMRTLDYLGLAESTPQPARAQLATPYMPTLADFARANRFRSYSVNNKDKYADEEEDEYDPDELANYEAQLVAAAQLQDQLDATHAAIHNHNLAVRQAFASQAAVTRPRAQTAGVLDAPSRIMRGFYPTPSRLDSGLTPAEIRLPDEKEFADLPQAVASLSLGRSNSTSNKIAGSSANIGLLAVEEQGLEGPTSALWLGSIPTSTTTSTLTEMFKSYGPILSARVLTHKNCGFVNFERVDSAITAKASMNGKEIFPGAGPIRINFAKPPSASNTPGHDGVLPSPSPDPFAKGQQKTDGGAAAASAGQSSLAVAGDSTLSVSPGNSTPTLPPLREMTADLLAIIKQFGASEEDTFRISLSVQRAMQFTSFIDEIPAIKEPAHTRVHDAPKLRDVRKRIDNQSLSNAEIENVAVDMLPEIAELSSDYLGNTVVQKLFEHCSDDLRDAMLAEIAPHMAEVGVHKNGTWAAQKIIDVCKTHDQMGTIVGHLRPYTVPLFLDQYGNYVLQGCLKFGAPYNDFIFETMMTRMWEISQGRYGARAMRACLESHHATKDQQRMLAAAIALHSVQLATNANGALLLTWFLDTCTFPQRRTVLSPQLTPFLVHLCTHKVAYLTVLKVINQKAEADARDTILKALFFTKGDQVLEAILADHACGATLIFKVLTTPFFDEAIRSQVVETVKSVLVRIKAQPSQGYKRLMDEVGLSTRSGGGGERSSGGDRGGDREKGSRDRDHSSHNERPRAVSRQASLNAANHQQQTQQHHQQSSARRTPPQQLPSQMPPQAHQQGPSPYGNVTQAQQKQQQQQQQFYNPLNPPAADYDAGFGIPRSENVESSLPQQFPTFSAQPPGFAPGANGAIPPVSLQQLQYQQSLLAARAAAAQQAPPMGNYFPAAMQAGFAPGFGANGGPSSLDQFRAGQVAAAALANGGGQIPQSQLGGPPGLSQMPTMTPAAQGGSAFLAGNPAAFGIHMGGVPPGMGASGFNGYPNGLAGGAMPSVAGTTYVQQEQQVNGRRGRVSSHNHPVNLNSRMQMSSDSRSVSRGRRNNPAS